MSESVLTIQPGVMRHPIGRSWARAIQNVILRHPNEFSQPLLELTTAGRDAYLHFAVDRIKDTSDPNRLMRAPFRIASVKLTYFPGDKEAREWLAAAWFGYVGHETLEMITIDDLKTKVLDPHAEPYETNPHNRCLRDGMPPELTPETLARTMALVIG